MAGSSNIQHCNEKAREFYGDSPLLQRICTAHGITLRDFAAIFGIGKSLAGEILNHQTLPKLELAVQIARYFECTVEELFGWRIDDDGKRRPLLVIDQETGQVMKLVGKNRVGAIELAVGKESGCGDEGELL
jgi:transcriptional regulator with XRE-family HTH domain